MYQEDFSQGCSILAEPFSSNLFLPIKQRKQLAYQYINVVCHTIGSISNLQC